MRPTCPYCNQRCAQLVPLVATTNGTVVDSCCRKCESIMQEQGFLWRCGSGWDRQQ